MTPCFRPSHANVMNDVRYEPRLLEAAWAERPRAVAARLGTIAYEVRIASTASASGCVARSPLRPRRSRRRASPEKPCSVEQRLATVGRAVVRPRASRDRRARAARRGVPGCFAPVSPLSSFRKQRHSVGRAAPRRRARLSRRHRVSSPTPPAPARSCCAPT